MVRTLKEQDELLTHHIAVQMEFNQIIERELNGIQATLKSHGQILVKLDERTAKIDTRVTKIDERVTKIDERVTMLDERVTGLEVKVTAMDEKFERRFDGLDEKMDLVLRVLTGRDKPLVPSARVAID